MQVVQQVYFLLRIKQNSMCQQKNEISNETTIITGHDDTNVSSGFVRKPAMLLHSVISNMASLRQCSISVIKETNISHISETV